MSQTLELKHLAPYLPYGLIMCQQVTRINDENESVPNYDRGKLLSYLGTDTPYIVWYCEYQHSGHGYVRNTLLEEMEKQKIKPILRPLSDLTKEIEIDGDKFIPLVKFYVKSVGWKDYKTWLHIMKSTYTNPNYLDFHKTMKLISWHFDVFGLIEKGLAIDINTLE